MQNQSNFSAKLIYHTESTKLVFKQGLSFCSWGRTGTRDSSVSHIHDAIAPEKPSSIGLNHRPVSFSIVLLTRQIFEKSIQCFSLPFVPLELVREVDHARKADHLRGVRLEVVPVADGSALARAGIQLPGALPLWQAPAVSREAKQQFAVERCLL